VGGRRTGGPYLFRGVRQRLVLELGEGLMERVLTENPGRAFDVEWR
jgi:5-phospho-D-xylono-1,4-lactonase